VVVVPLAYLFWLIQQGVNSVDQALLSVVLLVVVSIILLTSLRLPPGTLPEHLKRRIEVQDQGRVSFWALKILLTVRGEYTWRYLTQEMKELVMAVLAFREAMSPRDTERALEEGNLAVPPVIVSNFTHDERLEEVIPESWLDRLWERLRRLVKGQKVMDEQTNQDLEKIVRYMEDQLEIKYDAKRK
jgi:hypothetical protein